MAKIPQSSQNSLLLDGTKEMNANLDLGNNKIINLETFVDHKVDDDYDSIVKDLKSAVNKEYLMQKFFKKIRMITILISAKMSLKIQNLIMMGYLEIMILYQKLLLMQR